MMMNCVPESGRRSTADSRLRRADRRGRRPAATIRSMAALIVAVFAILGQLDCSETSCSAAFPVPAVDPEPLQAVAATPQASPADAKPAVVTPKPDRWSDDAVASAFSRSCGGYSTDELLITDELRKEFFVALAGSGEPEVSDDDRREALLCLLRLRKTGNLKSKTVLRGQPSEPAMRPTAEIAARVVIDRHRITTDTLLADPRYLRELQAEAEKISPSASAYQIRKAVLLLRKTRQLKPELVLQVAQWGRQIESMTLAETRAAELPANPGVYLFRDATGYLYVGEAASLRSRLASHLSGSDRLKLAEYLGDQTKGEVSLELHIFDPDSPAKQLRVRRAYESELIRSRTPRFNVRP